MGLDSIWPMERAELLRQLVMEREAANKWWITSYETCPLYARTLQPEAIAVLVNEERRIKQKNRKCGHGLRG